MSRFINKALYRAVLGMMLVITAAAPLFTLSIDADDDDDTPPVTVEMNLVAPAQKSVQTQADQAVRQVSSTGHREIFRKSIFSSHHQPTLNVESGSPQLVVPLRT
ncbi:MAG TPA: hypothetical protein VFR84_16225 [Candidatus Angelobacter sp.]|nr:hypothetical protein [Candidatus Angelobacter sp.]